MSTLHYLDLASMSPQDYQKYRWYWHRSLGREFAIEDLDEFGHIDFDLAHPLPQSPGHIGLGRFTHPLGYVELQAPFDCYTVISGKFTSGASSDSDDFQLLAMFDKGRDWLAVVDHSDIVEGRWGICLEPYYPPKQHVGTPMPVDSGELIDPPQGGTQVAPVAMVRLCFLDERLRPLAQPGGVEMLLEPLKGLSGRVAEPAGSGWRIKPGVAHSDFVHEPIEGGTDVVEPLSKEDRQFNWRRIGSLQGENCLAVVVVNDLADRVVLQLFSTEPDECFSVLDCPFDARMMRRKISFHA